MIAAAEPQFTSPIGGPQTIGPPCVVGKIAAILCTADLAITQHDRRSGAAISKHLPEAFTNRPALRCPQDHRDSLHGWIWAPDRVPTMILTVESGEAKRSRGFDTACRRQFDVERPSQASKPSRSQKHGSK
jgi:hypothetical protein